MTTFVHILMFILVGRDAILIVNNVSWFGRIDALTVNNSASIWILSLVRYVGNISNDIHFERVPVQ